MKLHLHLFYNPCFRPRPGGKIFFGGVGGGGVGDELQRLPLPSKVSVQRLVAFVKLVVY